MLAIRPNIGWLGYYAIGKSVPRIILVLAIFCAASFFLLQKSRESLSLRFMSPVLGGSSVIFLPPPDYSSFNSFDACAVESALNPVPSLSLSGGHQTTTPRPVYLYLWTSTIDSSNTWVQFLSKIKGITILYLNLAKSLKHSPVDGMVYSGGWGGRPGWAIWMASGGSLLWKSGGILLPIGVLMTKPIVLEAFGNNSGLLVAEKEKISPIAFGTPPHHHVVEQILDAVQNFNYNFYNSYVYKKHNATPLEHLLSDAVSSVCGVFPEGKIEEEEECKEFTIIQRDSVFDINFKKKSSLKEEKATFLRYTGDPYILKNDLGQSLKFFRGHALSRYCPQVFNYLEYETKKLL